jgi:hypothetical protein
MIRDERKVMLLGKHTPGKPKIYVFSAAGQLLSTLSVSQILLQYAGRKPQAGKLQAESLDIHGYS